MTTAETGSGLVKVCPLCDARVERFGPKGGRPDARCPRCNSLERHRLVWLYFTRETDLFTGLPRTMLHIAPEEAIAARLAAQPRIGYLSVDLEPSLAMEQMDITAIQFEDDSFDIIYCSHVLEHVPDDQAAMRELRRVLRPQGWALLMVPDHRRVTYENWEITTPAARLEHFGQEDHVRVYGLDFRDRLEDAGFRAQVIPYAQQLGEEDAERYGLMLRTNLYICRKQ